ERRAGTRHALLREESGPTSSSGPEAARLWRSSSRSPTRQAARQAQPAFVPKDQESRGHRSKLRCYPTKARADVIRPGGRQVTTAALRRPGNSVPRSDFPAVSGVKRKATMPMTQATIITYAGINSLPVAPISQLLKAGAVPPNSDVATL